MNFRRLFFLFISLIVANIICAQVPQAFHYQMVVRDANDVLVRSHSVGLRLTIQRNGGSPIYQETHNVMTDANGLLQIEVGRGTRNTTYGEFNAIPWEDYNDIVLISDIDPAGGTSYSLTATQSLQAVPYAFMADEHQDLANAAALGNRAGNYQLKSVKDPTDPQDVITKRYLDSVVAELVRRSNTLTRDTAACVNPSVTPYAWRGQSISIASTGSHTYTHTKPGAGAGGLDSIIILTLRVDEGTHNVNIVNQSGAYTWHGNNYAASGTYTYAYTDGNGCPSVDTLKLTISAAVVYGDTTPVEKCGSFTWYGTPLLASGDYTHTFVGAGPGGVDSILRLHLTIKPLGNRTLTETRCDTYHWDLEDADYTSTGTYSHTITGGSANGCDSIVRLELTINQTVYRDTAADKCEHFTWYGNNYTSTSNQTKTFNNGAANGCDSTIRLALTIRPKATSTDVHSACDSYDWIDGNNYTSDNNSATYTFTAGAANGCDSIVTLNLTINTSTVGTDNQTACDSYTWTGGNGNTYTVSNNTAVHHTTNVAGCDSAITLNLTLNQSTSAIDQQVACDSYTWINGTTYNSSTTTPTHTLTNAAGCDSVVTLNLTVNSSTTNALGTQYICGSTTTWHDNTYNVPGSYTYHGVNGSGCPLTETVTYVNGITYAADLKRDTVCAGTTSYVYNDTLIWADFTDTYSWNTSGTPSDNQWVKRNENGSVQWLNVISKSISFYYDACCYGCNQSYSWLWYDHTYGGDDGETYDENSSFMAVNGNVEDYIGNIIWTPKFTIENPENVYFSFWELMPARYNRCRTNLNGDYLGVYFTAPSNAGSLDDEGLNVYETGNSDYDAWVNVAGGYSDLPGLTAGDFRIKFLQQDLEGYFIGIDDILLYETKTINLSTYSPGQTWYSTTPTTNEHGCPHYSGRAVYIRPAGTTYNETACESYRWINGTTYTTNQTNTGYTHTLSYNGHNCSVTDRLNLTISSPASTSVTKVATNNYVWATSGSDGHGTGLTYNYSGNYIGPFYATGACQSRDTLHLTVNRIACAGSKYTIGSCTPFTWAASGAYGKGTGSTYSTVGTNQYVGPEYTPAGCAEGIHDTLVLTYGTAASTRYDIAECDSYTWPASGTDGHGTTTTYSTLGNHRYTGPTYYTAIGCASVDTLNLTLGASTHTEETQTVCDGVVWHEINRTTTGDHIYNYTNGDGCASTETLHLTVKHSKVFDTAITVCSGVTSVPTQRIVRLYYEDFENASTLDDWDIGIGTGAQYALDGWQRVSGSKAYDGYSLVCQSPINNSYVWASSYATTPLIYMEDPARTSISFKLKLPATWNWEDNYLPDLLQLYCLQEEDDDVLNNYDSKVIWDNTSGSSRLQASSWLTRTVSISALYSAPGNYSFVFRDRDAWSYAAIDSIDVRGPATIPVPQDLPIGTPTLRTTHYTAANGCDSTVNITWTVTSCGGHIDLNIDPSFASPIRENHPTPEYMECETQHGDCSTVQREEFGNNASNDYDYSNHLETSAMSKDSSHSDPSEDPDNSESYQADRPKAIRTRMAF